MKKDRIIDYLQYWFERITGKGCENCRCNDGSGFCVSPKYEKCIKSIFPKGYKRK